MRGKFTIVYQKSHDIDWFARKGDMMIHAMSFGGLLPGSVNQWITNLNIMRKAYQLPLKDVQVIYSNYAEKMMSEGINEVRESDRERYLRHFRDMAKRGFWSFDRDLHDENLYHLIARPASGTPEESLMPFLPELNDGEFDAEVSISETRDIGIVINRG